MNTCTPRLLALALALGFASPVLATEAGDWTVSVGAHVVSPASNNGSLAAHAGVDFRLADKRALRVDVRWMDIDTKVSVNGTDVGTVKIDPLVYGVAYVWQF